jgi:hypothetical protein
MRQRGSGQLTLASRSPRDPEISMADEMILLRVVADEREGWRWMSFEEFRERINLASWQKDQELVGMVLPRSRQSVPGPQKHV